MKKLTLFALFAFFAVSAHAQAPKGTLPPHQTTISWTNPTDPVGDTITGSNAYRCPGTCTASSGTFAVLNSTPISGTSYVDSAVTANTTYTYCVTNLVTLPTGSFETPCSAVVTATIPNSPGVPTAVTVSAQ